MTSVSQWPFPALIGDLGGTNLRLAIITDGHHTAPQALQTLRTGDYDDLGDAIAAYLDHVPGQPAPVSLAIAVATPAEPARLGPVRLTNDRGFIVDGAAVARRFGFRVRWILNDFEAQAWAAATMTADDLAIIGSTPPSLQSTLAVIGPGTGLGCAVLGRVGDSWHALPGEGGHVTLAARTPFEREVLAAALDGDAHLSAEALLSGSGLPRLYVAVARALDREPRAGLEAAAITEAAFLDDEAGRVETIAQQTIETFCGLLGGYAGNVALTCGARGGVLVTGGVANRLAEPLARGLFRARFEDKGRFVDYLREIGTARILREQPALDGLAWAISHVAERLPIQYD